MKQFKPMHILMNLDGTVADYTLTRDSDGVIYFVLKTHQHLHSETLITWFAKVSKIFSPFRSAAIDSADGDLLLTDNCGNQLYLSGCGCGPTPNSEATLTILHHIGFQVSRDLIYSARAFYLEHPGSSLSYN